MAFAEILRIADIRNGADAPVDDDTLNQDIAVIERAYNTGASSQQLQVLRSGDKVSVFVALETWLR